MSSHNPPMGIPVSAESMARYQAEEARHARTTAGAVAIAVARMQGEMQAAVEVEVERRVQVEVERRVQLEVERQLAAKPRKRQSRNMGVGTRRAVRASHLVWEEEVRKRGKPVPTESTLATEIIKQMESMGLDDPDNPFMPDNSGVRAAATELWEALSYVKDHPPAPAPKK